MTIEFHSAFSKRARSNPFHFYLLQQLLFDGMLTYLIDFAILVGINLGLMAMVYITNTSPVKCSFGHAQGFGV